MRYRLVPTRGWRFQTRHVEGDLEEARAAAREFSEEAEMPVLVCEGHVDGIMREVEMVGGSNKRRR